jgi:hypothetical protein
MNILYYYSSFFKKATRSFGGQLFFWLHLILLIYGFYERGNIYEEFHFNNEPLIFQVLIFLNIPAFFLTLVAILLISLVLTPIFLTFGRFSGSDTDYLFLSFLFLFAQFQWMSIGYWIELQIRKWWQK